MYVEPGFYELIPGTIGTVHYMFDASRRMSGEEKQKIVDQMSNARMRAYLNNVTYGLGGQNQMSPEDAFAKSRKDSWAEIEEKWNETKEIHVQVGQIESYNTILKIENTDGFKGWMNPLLIQSLKEICEKEKAKQHETL